MIHHSDYRRDITNAEAAIVGAVLAFGAVALMFYLAVARFHLRKEQLLEGGLYLVVVVAAVLAPALRKYATRGKRNKRPPYVIPARKDERAIEAAWPQAVVQTCVIHLLRASFGSAARRGDRCSHAA